MGTIHRGNGANNDTFNKVGGVSQWQNSPIKKHRICCDIIYNLHGRRIPVNSKILSFPTARIVYIAIQMASAWGACVYTRYRSGLVFSCPGPVLRSQQQRCKLPAFDAA